MHPRAVHTRCRISVRHHCRSLSQSHATHPMAPPLAMYVSDLCFTKSLLVWTKIKIVSSALFKNFSISTTLIGFWPKNLLQIAMVPDCSRRQDHTKSFSDLITIQSNQPLNEATQNLSTTPYFGWFGLSHKGQKVKGVFCSHKGRRKAGGTNHKEASHSHSKRDAK